VPATQCRRYAVVGAGPAGLAAATTLANAATTSTCIESAPQIGGQFNMALRVPGKEEFAETLRYFRRRIQTTGVRLQLNHTRRCPGAGRPTLRCRDPGTA